MSKLECTKAKRPWYRQVWMGTLCAAMAAVTAAHGLLPYEQTADAEGEALRKGRITAYVQDRPGLTLTSDLAARVDQVNYAFVLLKDGRADNSHWYAAEEIRRFLRQNPEVDGVLSVGGWGAEGFSDAVSTVEGRRTLADSILMLMDENGFRGVDMDWEYPASGAGGLTHQEDDWENYFQLLTLLREGLDDRQRTNGRDYLLSVALGASDSLIEKVDGERLAALVDQVNVMTYDLTGFDRITGHHAALWPSGDVKAGGAYVVQAYIARGIPETKINLGGACYGRAWRQASPSNNGLNVRAQTSGNKVYRYDQLADMLEGGETTRYWDEEAQAAWLFDGSIFISYEDDESLRAKAAYVLENNLLGVALWSADQDETGALLTALDTALTDDAPQEGMNEPQESDDAALDK